MRQIMEKYGEDIDQEPAIDCKAWIATASPPKKCRVYNFGESLDSCQVLSSSQGSCLASSSTFASATTIVKSESRAEHMMGEMETHISQRLRSNLRHGAAATDAVDINSIDCCRNDGLILQPISDASSLSFTVDPSTPFLGCCCNTRRRRGQG